MTVRWFKIFPLGQRGTEGIFDDPCSWTEKVDGSAFNWGVTSKYGLQMLTRRSEVQLGGSDKLFTPAVIHASTLADKGKLVDGWSYHAETLAVVGHNTLVYNRVPLNNLALYGVTKEDGTQISEYKDLKAIADDLEIDVVPELFGGKIAPSEALAKLTELLNTESFLGGPKIEGIVGKNYVKRTVYGGMELPLVQFKFVSEDFKEQHREVWPQNNKAPIQIIGEMTRTQARWNKARQHAAEEGADLDTVQAIGPVIKHLIADLKGEDADTIKNMLFSSFIKELERINVRGYPQYHKMRMIKPDLTLEEFDKGQKLVDVFVENETKEAV